MTTHARTIPAGRFKAQCLGLLDEVARTGQSYVVTKRGKAVARIVPVKRTRGAKREPPASLIGSVLYEEDIVSPTGEVWEVDQ